MILDTFELLERDKHGRTQRWHTIKCDTCDCTWDEDRKNTLKKAKRRDNQLCKECLEPILRQLLIASGTKALKSISPSDRQTNASRAGKISQASGKPSKTWFSSERWAALPVEEQREIVIRANAASVAKIKAMTDDEKTKHYLKVMKGAIGFESAGQIELATALLPYGFQGNVQVSNMCVDVCHVSQRIVVEYNGDAYHCRTKDQYSTLIKMTAGEKWAKDIGRYAMLKKMGYTVIVVWESDWKRDREVEMNRVVHMLTSLSNCNTIQA